MLNRCLRATCSASSSGRCGRGAQTRRRRLRWSSCRSPTRVPSWADEGLASPLAGRRGARAGRAASGGCSPRGRRAREIVVLTRATTDLRAYERALEERGIPTYLIGGRGYWSHPQVIDLVCYLRALANPRDEEALYTVLASPLVGVSVDALVVLAAASRASGRDPWWVLREPEARLDQLAAEDAAKLAEFARWFAGERSGGRPGRDRAADRPRARADRLRPRGARDAGRPAPPGERPQADAPGPRARGGRGQRAARFPRRGGRASRANGVRAESRESEAPVEGEALDAVRLMTIHRAKGLEFEIVCVADLGRGPPLAHGADAGRSRRPLRHAPGAPRHRQARARAALPGARGRAASGGRARGAQAVLRRDDQGARAPDPERRRKARAVAGGGRAAARSHGSARRCWATWSR